MQFISLHQTVLFLIQHPPHHLLRTLHISINPMLTRHSMILMNILQMQCHQFPLQFILLLIHLLHVFPHELVHIDIFIARAPRYLAALSAT